MGSWISDNLVSDRGNAAWSLAVLGLTIVIVEAVRLLLRKAKQKITETSAGGRGQTAVIGWRMLVEEAGPPLILFIWIWSVSAIALILFRRLWIQPDYAPVLRGVKWAEHLANAAAFFWLLSRLVTVVDALLRRWAARTEQKWDDVIAAMVARGLRLVVPLVGVIIVAPTLDIPERYHQFLREGTSVLVAGAVGFILYQLVATGEAAVVEQFRIDAADNLAQRKIQTQVKVLKRISVALIGLFTLASMLMVFEPVRHLATSLLASAGVAGIVIGFAAQKSLSTMVAGVQIAFTQPIRIDDVVIVEGEWGRIEEITMTYVVVVIWEPAAPGSSDHLFHRETVSELDARQREFARHGVPVSGLQRAGGGSAPGIGSNPGGLETLGWQGQRRPGDRCQGANGGAAHPGQRGQCLEPV